MTGLLIFRWLVPPQVQAEQAASQAVVRPAKPSAVAPAVVAAALVAPPAAPGFVDTVDTELPGNAFAVRSSPALPPMATAPPPVVKIAFTGPPAPPPPAPPPPPPPFQVVGTWDDSAAPGVFVATPNGTQLARKGAVLMAEYRVTAITPQLLLEQMSTKREFRFNVPRPASK